MRLTVPLVAIFAALANGAAVSAQGTPANPPVRHASHQHKVPNLEMDTKGTGAPVPTPGPSTSTADPGAGSLADTAGLSAVPASGPPIDANARAPATSAPSQPGGVATTGSGPN